jgi:hypothetical protein
MHDDYCYAWADVSLRSDKMAIPRKVRVRVSREQLKKLSGETIKECDDHRVSRSLKRIAEDAVTGCPEIVPLIEKYGPFELTTSVELETEDVDESQLGNPDYVSLDEAGAAWVPREPNDPRFDENDSDA